MNSEWQSLQPQTQQELKNTMNAMQPPQSIEEIKAGLETTEKGGVRQSIRNCLTVFQRDPLLSGAIAYNILTDRKDIIKPIGFHRDSTALNDTDMKYLLLYLEETYGLTNEKKIDNAIGIVANENKYHPIRDYLNTLVWDGTERIRFCLRHFLGADADDYTYEALKLFLLGAISRAFQPGCKFEIMLCLVGGQGAGKSTFFRLLAVRDEWFSDDLRKLDDDNVYRKLQGHWIIEMSEMMATANAKSIEEIKSFLSRQKEVYKIPYEWVWYKSRATGFLNANRAPLKKSENILVFYQKSPVYHPQFTYGEPYRKTNPRSGCSTNYGKFERTGSESSDGRRYPGNVLFVPTVTGGIHPTQKPVELCEYFIKTSTDEGEVVADICAGSGTTAVAAMNTSRRFICFENAPSIYTIAAQRIEQARLAMAMGEKGT